MVHRPFFLAALGSTSLLLLACSSSPPATPSPVTGITVSTGDLLPPFSPDVFTYEVSSLTTLVPTDITVTGQDVTIDGAPAKNGVPFETTLTALDDATSIAIQATDANGAPVTYTIRTAPQQRPRYDVTTLSSPEPGLIFLTPSQLVGQTGGPNFAYILDETGKLVFYKSTPQAVADFEKVVLPNGTVRYTYIQENQPMDPKTWPLLPSTAYVLDDHFRQLQTIQLAAGGGHPAAPVDVHEFRLLDDDHWIVQSYLGETVNNVPGYASSTVASGVVQEVKSSSVLFDWQTTSVPALYTQSDDGNDYTNAKATYADYNHLNAFDIDPSNGNFVLSLRHCDEVVELDHATGAIVWTFGGAGDEFGLAAADKPSHQHHVRFLEPNHLSMFDNGNATKLTRLREYQIDPAAHTAQALAAVTVDNHFSAAMGSLQKINGRYFVGWGFRQAGESDVTELDAVTQIKSFELSFQDGYISYRALKFPKQ
jgi:arylsulfate sulfotransferase